MHQSSTDTIKARGLLLLLTTLYLGFVIYGSLVPLNYKHIPLHDALTTFSNIRYLDLKIGSRADWVANILLFIPLSFLLSGLLWQSRKSIRIVSGILILTACLLLSLGIEFTQLFFPPRTVSQNDIMAETFGAVVGILAWHWKGPDIWNWLVAWKSNKTTNLFERILYVYLFILFGYNLLPLDLVISPVELFHKWKEGRILLIPFTHLPGNTAQFIYNLVTDIGIWIPVSYLWFASGNKNRMQAWIYTVIASICIESLQLFVYTRVTDTTDIITAMAGGYLGLLVARINYKKQDSDTQHRTGKSILFGIIGLVVTCIVLAVVFWYPFDFHLERNFLRERVLLFKRVPFHAYYYGTEYRAVTEVLHKIAFFMPLGFIAAYLIQRLRDLRFIRLLDIFVMLAMSCLALGIEIGQVALPGKSPSTTDWLLESIGAGMGYWLAVVLLNRKKQIHEHQR